MKYYIKKKCRLCDSENLVEVLNLNQSPLCDAYLKSPKKQILYNLNLQQCVNCDFIQLDTIVNPEFIYRDYIYVTTSSSGLSEHFNHYSEQVFSKLNLTQKDLVVDVGSNDGTLLKYFQQQGCETVGIEPAFEISKIANQRGIKTYCEFLSENTAHQIVSEHGKASVITINNLFANIDNLLEMAEALSQIIDNHGTIVIESSYLYDMMNNMVFDFIYHEHLSYFSLKPLRLFFAKFGMEIWSVKSIPTKGGSLRYFISRKGIHHVEDSVHNLVKKELSGIELTQKFITFSKRIAQEKEELLGYLAKLKKKKIVGYGASATSTTLISHFELYNYLSLLVDDNPAKMNTFSPGFHIPVYSSEKLEKERPDIILILAWRYKAHILNKLQNLSCEKILPLPKFHVL